jgi:hypothetical protein
VRHAQQQIFGVEKKNKKHNERRGVEVTSAHPLHVSDPQPTLIDGACGAAHALRTKHSGLPAIVAASSRHGAEEEYCRVRFHTLARRREEEDTVRSVRLLSDA